MEVEKIVIRLLIDKKNIIEEELVLIDESPDDEEMVILKIIINGEKFSYKSDNFFSALTDLRRDLEKRNMRIICNGAAENVYPSPMQLAMGYGRKAYKLYMEKQALAKDIVDIFEYDEVLDCVNIDEQSKFYAEWKKSIMG